MNRRLFALAPLLAVLAACATQPAPAPASVAETIAGGPQLSTLNALVAKATTQADLFAGNGVVHTVDRVLMPPRR